jgi:D-alanyl-D-alanine-carboxypeptidase/D-alanyl-D-alanine-endopeptidase
MKNAILFLFVLFVFCAAPGSAAASSDVQTILDRHVAGMPGVGIVAGVVDRRGESVFYSGTSGTKRMLDAHTLFEIGSVTKTFTATILSSMVLDGSVRLDDPVSKYLPSSVHVPARDGKQITLLNLATQHSGLPRLPSNMDPLGPDPYARYSLRDLYVFLNTYQLPRDPGQSYEYSNLGIGLLGDALAYRSHTSYVRLLQSRVLGPLGMNETTISPGQSARMRVAAGHDADGDVVAPWTFDALAPAGALNSTVDDMMKFVRCNMGQGPLAKMCLSAQKPRSEIPGNRIGLVWMTGDIEPIIHHDGATAGYQASVAISPDHSRGVVVLTNGGAGVDDIAFHILDPKFPVAMSPNAVTLSNALLDSYVGMYENRSAGLTFAIRHVGDTVTVQLAGQPQFRMLASAKDVFTSRTNAATITFLRTSDDGVGGLVLHQGGADVSAIRVSPVAVTPTAAPSPSPAATTPQPSTAPAASAAGQPTTASSLDDYLGTYNTAQGPSFTVTRSDTQLIVQFGGQPAVPVYRSANDSFSYKIVDAQIDFQRDAAGKVASLTLHQNGITISAVRSKVPHPQPTFPPVVALDDATLDGYLGTYVVSPSFAFTVTRSGDQLMVQLTGQPAVPVYASAKDEFFYKAVEARISFQRDAGGIVKALVLHQNGRDVPATKT